MKKSLCLLLIIILFLFSCQDKKYSVFAPNTDQETLLKAIECNFEVDYWEINYVSVKPETIFQKGNPKLKELINYKSSMDGFFTGCQPLWCAYNIIYLKNGEQFIVTDVKELKGFIGNIDNEMEAFLIALVNDYEIDWENWKGKSFLKTNNGYNLKAAQIQYCPVKNESFLLEIYSDGSLKEIKSLGIYLESKDCILF